VLANQADRAVDVLAGLGVKRDPGGARLCEVGHDAVDRFDHQVHVDRRVDAGPPQGLADERPDREVGHVVVVHDVEVHDVRAGVEHLTDFLAEARKIRRQD